MTRIMWHAELKERYPGGESAHSFSGDYDASGEWVPPSAALHAIGMSIWNFIEAATEGGGAADRFALTIRLDYADGGDAAA